MLLFPSELFYSFIGQIITLYTLFVVEHFSFNRFQSKTQRFEIDKWILLYEMSVCPADSVDWVSEWSEIEFQTKANRL